ncbi:MAG: hypothetical protein FWC89_04085 [Defluviitaleaceae bacterium]|nr:hypothetical protein [Defluviitaleaceae bacterium]
MSISELTTRANNGDQNAQREIEQFVGYPAGTYAQFISTAKENKQAAERGNVRAMVSLGEAYLSGAGVNKDFTAAKQWFEKAAERNDPTGTYRLGCVHFVNDEYIKAKECINKAVSMGQILNVTQEEIQKMLEAINLLLNR